MYKRVSGDDTTVQHVESGKFIPAQGVNIDSQTYNYWLKEGGVLLPADLPDPVVAIQQQIAQIEAASQITGPMRIFMLANAQEQAQEIAAQMTAAGKPTTAAQLLLQNIMYQKVLAVDTQIKALEAQLPS